MVLRNRIMSHPRPPLSQVFLQAIVLTGVQALVLWVFLKVLHWSFFPSLFLAAAAGIGIWYALLRLLRGRALRKGV